MSRSKRGQSVRSRGRRRPTPSTNYKEPCGAKSIAFENEIFRANLQIDRNRPDTFQQYLERKKNG